MSFSYAFYYARSILDAVNECFVKIASVEYDFNVKIAIWKKYLSFMIMEYNYGNDKTNT